MDTLNALFSSKAKALVIATLFSEALPELFLRELGRLTNLDTRALHNELGRLVEVDLVERREDGNRVYFKAKTAHPICSILVELIKKTTGIEQGLRSILAGSDDVEMAFIFGSYVKGDFAAHSDIDLFCVGDISSRELSDLLYDFQSSVGREINFHLYGRKEFEWSVKNEKHFVKSLGDGPKVVVKGDEDECKRLFVAGKD